jgi:hypothetical protein
LINRLKLKFPTVRKISKGFPILLFFFLSGLTLTAQKKVYQTQHIPSTIVIDGLETDEAWNAVEWGGDFTQRQPSDGTRPSQKTAFKVLYDEKNLYILVRAYDDEPSLIVKRMSRRDGFEGDFVEINIDSYNDKRSAFSFTASVSGVKGDEAVSNDGNNWDSSWDPIWYLKTSIDDKGWIAEYRIPLSQLRFANKEEQVWGFQVSRRIFRKDEWSNWQYIPKNSPGWVHLFGELHGLKGIKPQKQVEIMPYIVGKTERFEREEGNPYVTGKESKITAGVDGKIGITSDITLDFSLNPDFGQVEADPSQVNLTAFEVFFREQRPFFVESKNILDYTISTSAWGGSFTSDNLFYSRRIGRQPQYSPELRDDEYMQNIGNSTILGSFKLTGKTKKGLSFGILEAVTDEERAKVFYHGETRKIAVEPLTNYLVGRVQQDINKGRTIVGGIVTATDRRLDDSLTTFLHREAYSAGVDIIHQSKDRNYYISGNFLASKVIGSQQAILETQASQRRYFQRPYSDHVEIDSTRRDLVGTGGTIKLGKKGGGHFRSEIGGTFRSPGFEINDIGYMRSADQIHQWIWVGYQTLKEFGIFRSLYLNVNNWTGWDFSGARNYMGFNFNTNFQFKNFWVVGGGISKEFDGISNYDLRGGPSIRYPGGISGSYFVGTDSRKKLKANIEYNYYRGDNEYYVDRSFAFNLTYQPLNSLQFSLTPRYNVNNNELQYVDTQEVNGSSKIVLGRIHQKTLSMQFRINYIITPNLSVQYYGQPFASKGTYSKFKEVTASRDNEYHKRFALYSPGQLALDDVEDVYNVDEDRDGLMDYSFDKPDFDVVEFRSNFVVRWEYIPGSTLFLVWSQSRNGDEQIDRFSPSQISNRLGISAPHDVFLIKYTYRFRF